MFSTLFAQAYDTTTVAPEAGAAAGGGAILIVYLILAVVGIVAMWKLFAKAGQPGWAAIIPIYNVYVLLKVAGRPGWWLVLYLIPFVNIAVSILVGIDVAKKFGYGGVFGGVLCGLLGIGYLIIGFSSAKYDAKAPTTKLA